MKQVEVTIMGQGYILGCPEGGEALLATQLAAVTNERDNLRSRLNAARSRIDGLLQRLPREPAVPDTTAVDGKDGEPLRSVG